MDFFDSPSKRKRVGQISAIVIHYTEADWPTTKKIFLNPPSEVSAHLVIDQDGTVYRFVQDDHVAYHAGRQSYWHGLERMNEYSIGIELVHSGFSPTQGIKIQGDINCWASYDGRQIQTLIQICKDYSTQYNIAPHHIVGHSDIASWRYNSAGKVYAAKQDPGPLFPWRRLYNEGIGRWYTCHSSTDIAVDHVGTILNQLGYRIPPDQKAMQLTLRAFQMHYRPRDISGILDQETWDIMTALLQQENSVQSS